ncbi:hypothetical protein PHMEG_00030726, partial [Phytophthora megakarya]
KTLAIAGRNRYVSVMIETWGYYATVNRLESSGHRAFFGGVDNPVVTSHTSSRKAH